MDSTDSRTRLLLGDNALQKLKSSHVIVFGAGGVGGYAIEALARSFVGSITVVDSDVIEQSNINRQILATTDVISKKKTEVAKQRILSINPDCKVYLRDCFFLPENSHTFDFSQYDYIVDAVDTVSAKIELCRVARDTGVPIISSMGTGNKLHPELLTIADIYDTSVCPLARTMRSLCRKNGIQQLDVVYSTEPPAKAPQDTADKNRSVISSSAFVPAAAGMIMASKVVQMLIGTNSK